MLEPDQPYDHLILASTLPFLLLPGVHHLEGWDESVSEGAWGRPGKWVGEKLRQALDLEHWAAWRESFAEVTELVREVVTSDDPPSTVLLLGGDVHCSYTAVATLTDVEHPATAIHQLTMSPFRNDIERVAKAAFTMLNRKGANAAMHGLARLGKVADVGMSWIVEHGVWFDNGVMSIDLAGRGAELSVDHALVENGEQVLRHTLDVELAPGTPSPDSSIDGATAAV